MTKSGLTGDLERAVMDRLWSAPEPQTVHQVQAGLSGRPLAYTTIMTVLRRLVAKKFVVQLRDARPHRYAAVCSREDVVAELMLDLLKTADDSRNRVAAVVRFVELVGNDEVCALRRIMAQLDRNGRPRTDRHLTGVEVGEDDGGAVPAGSSL